jgi:hypothetical protein
MASIFKSKGASKYTILYMDENGRRRKKAGTSDKAVSERIARDLENRVALLREGVVDRKAESYRDHEARPLAEHLAEFRRAQEAKKLSENGCNAHVTFYVASHRPIR